MRRRHWFGLVLLPAFAAVAGCADTPSRVGRCEALRGAETAAALPGGRPATSRVTSEDAHCTWTAGASALDVTIHQPVSYAEREPRADDRLAQRWIKDDQQYVTAAVPGVGRAAYRFTRVDDDMVTVTVRAYRGYREVTVTLSAPHPRRGGLGGLEAAAVAVAGKAVSAT